MAPGHLQAVAHLYGIAAPSLERARVLVLGCEGIDAFFTHAFACPQAEILGVDLDPALVEAKQQQARKNALDNVKLHALDLPALLAQDKLGAFDYILVGGVYALLGKDTRLALLTFCQKLLSPAGIVCFEYSTHPGGKLNDIVRDALMLHCSLASDDTQRLESARGMLTFLHQGMSPQNPMATVIRQLAAKADQYGDAELALTYLHGLNEPCYLIEFNDLATQAGLCYVGDAQPHLEMPDAWGDNVATLCRAINPGRNKVLGQQYLDFACNRASRLSILTRQDRIDDVLPEPDIQRFKQLRLSGYFRRPPIKPRQIHGYHTLSNGEHVTTTAPIHQAVLDTLGQAWPASVDFDLLMTNSTPAVDTLKPDDGQREARLLDGLRSLFCKLGADFHYALEPTAYDTCKTPYLARVGAVPPVPELDKQLSDADRRILTRLDGKTPVAQLASGAESDGLAQSLNTLYRLGLLQGSHAAWIDYWKFELDKSTRTLCDPHPVCCLIMHTFPPSQGGLGEGAGYRRTSVQNPRHEKVLAVVNRNQAQGIPPQAALEEARKLVKSYPDVALAWSYQFLALFDLNQTQNLLDSAIQTVLALPEPHFNNYLDIATALNRLDYKWASQLLFNKLLRINPANEICWNNLGQYYADLHENDNATRCFQQCIALDKNTRSGYQNLAVVLSLQSKNDEAMAMCEKALALTPNNWALYSNYLFISQHSSALDAKEVFRRHLRYGEQVEASIPRKAVISHAKRDRNPDRPLRIGVVSADLRNHAVSNFVEPYFKDMDHESFQLYFYSNSIIEDNVSERFKSYAKAWHRVTELDDAQLAALIAGEHIDILFDLSGHTAHNRLPVFAYKPAPIQLTWIGYPGTTGLRAMDYILFTGTGFGPIKDYNQPFVEQLIFAETSISPFSPSPESPPVSPLPCLSGAPFTYGSFNRQQKITDQTLELWAAILHRAPQTRLLLGGLEIASNQQAVGQEIKEKMSALGISEDRLILCQRTTLGNYLALHGQVDLLLDTFPYAGGTTTNHALWMGVPTLTMAGGTAHSDTGAAIMAQWGLIQFITHTPQSYIDNAVGWSKRAGELAEIRQSLRPKIAAAAAEKNVLAARALERNLRHLWQHWCSGKPPEPVQLRP